MGSAAAATAVVQQCCRGSLISYSCCSKEEAQTTAILPIHASDYCLTMRAMRES
jgi:hypothetical protein